MVRMASPDGSGHNSPQDSLPAQISNTDSAAVDARARLPDDDDVNTAHHINSSSSSPWARLVSINGSCPNIELWKDEIDLGQIHVHDSKQSNKPHCSIYRDSLGNAFIKTHSGNDTCGNNIIFQNDDCQPIHHGDEIALGPSTSDGQVYIFQMLHPKSTRHVWPCRKRGFEEMDSMSSMGSECFKLSKVMDDFKCSICLSIWHDVVSVAPCLHNFCNGCFSEFLKNKGTPRCKCPECREGVVFIARNHTLNSMIETFLKEFPSLKRSPEEIAHLDKMAIVGNHYMNIGIADSELSGSDDEEEELNVGQCPQCPRHNTLIGSSYQCGPETVHITCSACFKMMPQRTDIDIPQRCAGCHRIFCELYWNQFSAIPSTGQMIACSRSGTLKKINQQHVLDVPTGSFRGNIYEQNVTRRYIQEQRIDLQDVVNEWLNKLCNGEIEKPDLVYINEIENMREAYFCNQCADIVIEHLIYQFRCSIPKCELPPDAAGREDCWYGWLCRTQTHKLSHAQKYNHVCRPGRC